MREYIIVTLLVVVLVCSAYAVQSHMHRQVENFHMEFDRLESILAVQNDPEAKALCVQLVEDWDKKREFWEVFIDHSALDEAQTTIYEMKGYVLSNAPDYVLTAAFSKLDADLIQIDMQTRLTLGHLF